MILKNATILYKGYDPLELTKGSNKRVCVSCNECGRVRYVPMYAYRDLCVNCGNNTKNHCESISSRAKERFENKENHPLFGKRHSDESKQLMSDNSNNVGKLNPMFGHKHTDETKQRMKNNHYDCSGENNGRWNGGYQKRIKRANAKRREFKYIPLNDPFPNSEGHHITKSLVIHIPKELHKHIRHNIHTGLNMKEINALALQYLYGEI